MTRRYHFDPGRRRLPHTVQSEVLVTGPGIIEYNYRLHGRSDSAILYMRTCADINHAPATQSMIIH